MGLNHVSKNKRPHYVSPLIIQVFPFSLFCHPPACRSVTVTYWTCGTSAYLRRAAYINIVITKAWIYDYLCHS